ncbi:hypothetical protein [Lacticaseibacillus absianus]|nr:hypothetical protein [Lacticaseibacillus absianus]
MIPIDPISFLAGVGIAALVAAVKGKRSWRDCFVITDDDMDEEEYQ